MIAESNIVPLKDARRRGPVAKAAPSIDRLPPHSIEAEQGVLGCIFLSPHQCVGECQEKILSPDVFYDLRHRTLWEILCEMTTAQEGIDVITVMNRLKDAGQLEAVGGIAYLATLPDSVPSAANLSYYVNIILEKYALRVMVRTCTDIIAKTYENEGTADEILAESTRELNDLNSKLAGGAKKLTVKEAVHLVINEIEARYEDAQQGRSSLAGLSTGFPDLDKLTCGMRRKDMIVIGARPSEGKTSLAMNIAEAVAIDQKLPVGVISMEMSTESLVKRMLCTRGKLDMRRVNEGFLSERDFPKITSAAGIISNAPIYIDDTPSLTVPQLRGKLRWMVQQFGIKLAVIDYLQLLHGGGRFENRNAEITFISGQVKSIAKELDIPVLILAQLNRELEKDKKSGKASRKPRMSDLRDGGAIEQDADLIGLLYRPSTGEDEDSGREQECVPVNLLIAKQRNGPRDVDVHLTFFMSFTKFESAAKISADDIRP